MSETIDAKYEDGVLKPLKKLSIKEGSIVSITVYSKKRVTKRF